MRSSKKICDKETSSTIDRRSFLAGISALGVTAATSSWAREPTNYPMPDHELMVPVEGGRIYVRINGDLAASNPPIVVIHGGPGGSHSGYLDALALANERAVILYDQLDCGKSDRPMNPANWRVPRFADELDAIRNALAIKRWHIFGVSWGGTVALEYGARKPSELASLVLGCPLVSSKRWLADTGILRKKLPADVQQQLTKCDSDPNDAGCDAAGGVFNRTFLWREPLTTGRKSYEASTMAGHGFNGQLYETMWGRSEFVSTGMLKDYDGEALLKELDGSNTLFVGGQHDEVLPTTLEEYAARLPGSEFAIIPGAAHSFLTDRPAETLSVLNAWMKRHQG